MPANSLLRRILFSTLLSTLQRTRFFSVPFVGLLAVVMVTVYTPRLSDRAVYCLVAGGYSRNARWYTMWGDPGIGQQINFAGRQVDGRPYLASNRPAEDWAVHGQHQAFLEFPTWSAEGRLVMNAPELDIHREFVVPIGYGPRAFVQNAEFAWANDGSGNYLPTRHLDWSPDGRSVLFSYLEYASDFITRESQVYLWHYSLFGLDGSAYPDAMIVPQDHPYPIGVPWMWTSDSRVVFYPQMRTNPLTLPPSTEATDAAKPWLLVPHFEKNVYNWNKPYNDNRKMVQLLFTVNNQFAQNVDMNVLADPDSIGAVNWSPDGKWFALVSAIGKGSARTLSLVWGLKQYFPASPSQPMIQLHKLEDNLWDVRNVVWLTDGHFLAYIAERNDGVGVEILNLNSGWHYTLRAGLESVAWLNQNPATGLISFWWRNQQGEIGIDSFTADGRRLYDSKLPLQIDGLEIFRDPYRWIRWPEIYPSPDGRVIAVYYEHADAWYSNTVGSPSFLELIAADGSWSKLVTNVDALKMGHMMTVVWSPDGRYLLYARDQNYSGDGVHIDVLNPDGSLAYSFDRWPITSAPVTWSPCP